MFNPMDEYGAGPEGPMVSGKWIDKRTGAVINVRDSIIADDDMIIISDKGQISFTEFSQYYIQASDETFDAAGNVISNEQMAPTDVVNFTNTQRPIIEPNKASVPYDTQSMSTVTPSSINNYELIDKIFKKTESTPTFKFAVDWADFPKNELQMLVDYFDVSIDDIAKYVTTKFINQQTIVDELSSFVKSKMDS